MLMDHQTIGSVLCCKCGISTQPNAANMCESCSKVQGNPDEWVCAVKLRQQFSYRRTFFYLERLILENGAAASAISIEQMDQGIDFFFSHRSDGAEFVEFIRKVAPIMSYHIMQPAYHDPKNNKTRYKYTFCVDICPICHDDLICLPPEVAVSLGNLGPLVICTEVTNCIALLDPFTLRHCYLDSKQYFRSRSSFESLLTSSQLVQYIVLGVEVVSSEVTIGGTNYVLANARVARMRDFGKNDKTFSIRTHLGHCLNPGDYALGYDLCRTYSNDIEFDKYRGLVLPDAILVKKCYEEKHQKRCGKSRLWMLKSLDMEVDDKARADQDKMNSDYEQFLKELEENPDLRFNISLFRNKEYQPSETASMTDGDDLPSVPLEELLADLDLRKEEDEEDNMIE